MYKLVFFVPIADADHVKESIFKTGAGTIGEYSKCSWEVEGIGQFMPSEKSNPTIGKSFHLERVPEKKVEILCQESQIKEAVKALKSSHPYEEPAFEILKVYNHLFS